MTKMSDLHRRWRKDADDKAAYDALGEEFDLARALIEARAAAGLSQSQLAKKMKASQSYIARIEGGKVRPSTDALERFAQATRTRLRIIFEPEAARRSKTDDFRGTRHVDDVDCPGCCGSAGTPDGDSADPCSRTWTGSSELPKASRERGDRGRHRLSQKWPLWPIMATMLCRC